MINKISFIISSAAIPALGSIVAACAVIFGTDPKDKEKYFLIYKIGLFLSILLVGISLGIIFYIFFL